MQQKANLRNQGEPGDLNNPNLARMSQRSRIKSQERNANTSNNMMDSDSDSDDMLDLAVL